MTIIMQYQRAAAIVIALVDGLGALSPRPAQARPTRPVLVADHPMPRPTLFWLATQLVPSPGLAVGAGEASLSVRWQLTPVLYAWGVNSRVRRWRTVVVEPNARYGGAIELFAAPEVVLSTHRVTTVRPGVRAYLPVRERGEALAVSVGLAYQRVAETDAVAIEVGAYALFGIVGLQLSYAPGPATPAQTIATLQLRYF